MTLAAANNLNSGIAKFRAGHVGLVVLVNRYDGIDLPQSACRILVVDGSGRASENRAYRAVVLGGSEQIASQYIQRIEQGMGAAFAPTRTTALSC